MDSFAFGNQGKEIEKGMKFLLEELDVFFESDKLLYTHNQEVVIALPALHELSPSQVILLKTILNRMGFATKGFAWIYYAKDSEETILQESILRFAPKILLLIRPISDEGIVPEHKIISGTDSFYLPHPQKFEFNDAIKRPIWNLLKPFSCV